MPTRDSIVWFKSTFGRDIDAALSGKPFDLDQLVAIACQETGYIWDRLRKLDMPPQEILTLCVGDTIDYKGPGSGRQAFPKNKAHLLTAEGGAEMFAIARQALEKVGTYIDDYKKAAKNPDKFCRGFGLFQRDLQFFVKDPDYFINRKYENIDDTLKHCLDELARATKKLDLDEGQRLSDDDFCKVAIAYNTGGYRSSKGLKQGHFDGQRYYGEWIAEYISLSRSANPAVPAGSIRRMVNARTGVKLRTGPSTDYDTAAILPYGTQLDVIARNTNDPRWAFVDLEGDGLIDGCVFAAFLAPLTPEHAAEPS